MKKINRILHNWKRILKFIWYDKNILSILTISSVIVYVSLLRFNQDDNWTGKRIFSNPFLVSCALFLVFTRPSRCVIDCSTTCSRAAERLKWMNTQLFLNWPKRHSMIAQQFGLIFNGVTGLVLTEQVRNKLSILKSLHLHYSCN